MSRKSQNRIETAEHVKESEPSRRTFLRGLWIGLGILAVAEFAGVVFAFLRPRKSPVSKTELGGIIEAGPIDDFKPESVTAFILGQFYLSRLKDGGFLDISRKCTHLGCTVTWDSDGNIFLCPCHSSAFDLTGEVISPPAPRPLDLHPVDIENGIVRVDTGKKIKRKSFKLSQVVRP
jgi:cytochrome b6-f complex iron-sulfur subunit